MGFLAAHCHFCYPDPGTALEFMEPPLVYLPTFLYLHGIQLSRLDTVARRWFIHLGNVIFGAVDIGVVSKQK